MNISEIKQRLSSLINDETVAAKALLDALNEEQRALREHKPDKLEQSTTRKNACHKQLEALEGRRTTLFSALRIGDQRQQAEAWFAKYDANGAISAQWQQLLGIIGECQHLNLVNGSAIEASKRRVHKGLDLLRGNDAQAVGYDPHGQSTRNGDSRTIAKA